MRAIRGIDQRLQEAKKMGFTTAIIPKSNVFKKNISGLKVKEVETVSEALELVLY